MKYKTMFGKNNPAKRKEVREKISNSLQKEKNPNWKGNNAGYDGLHIWIRRNNQKPKLCEECHKEKKLDLANIKNHNYTRKINDYKWLCRSCHEKKDWVESRRRYKGKFIK